MSLDKTITTNYILVTLFHFIIRFREYKCVKIPLKNIINLVPSRPVKCGVCRGNYRVK